MVRYLWWSLGAQVQRPVSEAEGSAGEDQCSRAWRKHYHNSASSCEYRACVSRRIFTDIIIIWPNSIKPQAWKLDWVKTTTTTGYHTASNVARKATASSLWRAIDKRWNRNTVSLVSSVTAVMRLPVYWISSMADWFQMPAVSTATGKKDVRGRERTILYNLIYSIIIIIIIHAKISDTITKMLQEHCTNSSVTYHMSAVTATVTTDTVMFGHCWKLPETHTSTNWRHSLFCCCTVSMEQATDGAETAAINGLISSYSENIFVSFCLRAPGCGLTLWCARSLLVGVAIQVPQLQLQYSYMSTVQYHGLLLSALTDGWFGNKGKSSR